MSSPIICAILSIILTNRSVIKPINILKNQMTNSSLYKLYVNDWEKKRKIGINILHLISHDL